MKKLKEHRIDRMLTVRDLAAVSRCAVTTVMAIERGSRKPHFGTMVAIAGALGVGVREIEEFDEALVLKAA